MRNSIRSAALALAIALPSGCVTIGTLSEDKPCNKMYSGTIGNFTHSWWLAHSLFLDIPFSLVADTVVLPYSIPKTILNYARDDSACKEPEPDDEVQRNGSGQPDRTMAHPTIQTKP